jgi:hypothetical protein
MYLQNLGLVLFPIDGDIDVFHGGFLLDKQCKQDANEGEDNQGQDHYCEVGHFRFS